MLWFNKSKPVQQERSSEFVELLINKLSDEDAWEDNPLALEHSSGLTVVASDGSDENPRVFVRAHERATGVIIKGEAASRIFRAIVDMKIRQMTKLLNGEAEP